MDENKSEKQPDEMHRREITLADGRYMIFFTFGDENELKMDQSDQREDV